MFKGPDSVFEVSVGRERDIDRFMFFARAGESAISLMSALADPLGAALFDTVRRPTLMRHQKERIWEAAMARVKGVVGEFKDFVLRGNVIDLAIAVVIGTAFGMVVTALVKDLLTPIVAAIFGKPNFGDLKSTINNSQFLYGDFINAVITFLSIAAAVFFCVVKPVNVLTERRKRAADPVSDDRPCPECLSQIPKAARRCSHCTAEVEPLV